MTAGDTSRALGRSVEWGLAVYQARTAFGAGRIRIGALDIVAPRSTVSGY